MLAVAVQVLEPPWLTGLGVQATVPPSTGLAVAVIVMTVLGGLAAPLIFQFFGLLTRTFGYAENIQPGFRPDREIRRGRY